MNDQILLKFYKTLCTWSIMRTFDMTLGSIMYKNNNKVSLVKVIVEWHCSSLSIYKLFFFYHQPLRREKKKSYIDPKISTSSVKINVRKKNINFIHLSIC